MNSLLAAFFLLGVTVTLSQARYNYKNLKQDGTNLLFKRTETLRKLNKLIGKTNINAQDYAIETDTKLVSLKQDKRGLLMRLLRHRNETQIKEIRIGTVKDTSAPSTTTSTIEMGTTKVTPDNNNVKMPLNQNDYINYELADSKSKTKSNEHLYDYFSSQVAIFPWPVKKDSKPFCAGSLVSKRYVLTTANCVDGEKRVVIVFGARNIQELEPSQVKMESSNFIIHKNWNSETLKSNIALIKLAEPVEFNEYISVVNLPTKADENKSFTDYNATLVAWSSDHEESIAKPVKTTDVIISNVKCFFTYQSMILSSHICLASSRSNTSCVGENGDQLIVEDDDGIMKLIGLLSFGMTNGCEQKQPVVFTRVTSYLPWILSYTEML